MAQITWSWHNKALSWKSHWQILNCGSGVYNTRWINSARVLAVVLQTTLNDHAWPLGYQGILVIKVCYASYTPTAVGDSPHQRSKNQQRSRFGRDWQVLVRLTDRCVLQSDRVGQGTCHWLWKHTVQVRGHCAVVNHGMDNVKITWSLGVSEDYIHTDWLDLCSQGGK